MINIKNVTVTAPQLMVVVATLAASFLQDIAPDLHDIGVPKAVIHIVARLLTFVLGIGLYLKTGADPQPPVDVTG